MLYRIAKAIRKKGNKIKNQNAPLRNSTLFSKSIENPVNKFDVKIVPSRKDYLKW